MIDLNTIPQSYQDAIEVLAGWHSHEGLEIYSIDDPQGKIVRLIEVSVENGDDEVIRPITMGASADFPYKSQVILMSPRIEEDVRYGLKPLPDRWDATMMKKIWPDG